MNFNRILKDIDPVISGIINKVIEGNDISESETIELFNSRGLELNMIVTVANYLCKRKKGDIVTYVINRNINFTNVCIKRCGFCAFSRDFREEEGYYLPTEEIVRRAKEAEKLGATEICIQAGLPPKMDGYLYIDICKAIKKELPNIHIHAFSPEEILYGAKMSDSSIKDYLQMLKEAGLDSIPGTAAEILDQKIRDTISPGRISVQDWIKVIKQAHSIGINSTSTIMYGHIESYLDIVKHLAILKDIQKETGGFTEFVPLSFVHSEAPMYNRNLVKNIRAGPTGEEVLKMHAVARIFLNNYIENLQVSWVKEGPRMAQILLEAGVNDFGGTLINESISTSAGASFGQLLKPKEIRNLIYNVGKIPAQRSSKYEVIKTFSKDNNYMDDEELLDKSDTKDFGSYHELIKMDSFRFKRN
ncbi:MAG TPA: 5-amino-6-(D-ribitylamino)uracil--L-tyrosine 4-hydroxyphenyl transferase CofH [Nitrososphaeraceae archaeon]|nr:5-amino-6-(D-ribitylamino)uracil--L-tyrosine 4-hydroxyphenyl transferase CofH [Nitrososphaeraceae archaeon]